MTGNWKPQKQSNGNTINYASGLDKSPPHPRSNSFGNGDPLKSIEDKFCEVVDYGIHIECAEHNFRELEGRYRAGDKSVKEEMLKAKKKFLDVRNHRKEITKEAVRLLFSSLRSIANGG